MTGRPDLARFLGAVSVDFKISLIIDPFLYLTKIPEFFLNFGENEIFTSFYEFQYYLIFVTNSLSVRKRIFMKAKITSF
jgi:hypothetical protein